MLCTKCKSPLDPWGECTRCPSREELKSEKKRIDQLRMSILREHNLKPAMIHARLIMTYPSLTIEIIEKVLSEAGARRKKRNGKLDFHGKEDILRGMKELIKDESHINIRKKS